MIMKMIEIIKRYIKNPPQEISTNSDNEENLNYWDIN